MCFPSDVNDAGHWLSKFLVPGHAADNSLNLLKIASSESCLLTKVRLKCDENKNMVGGRGGRGYATYTPLNLQMMLDPQSILTWESAEVTMTLPESFGQYCVMKVYVSFQAHKSLQDTILVEVRKRKQMVTWNPVTLLLVSFFFPCRHTWSPICKRLPNIQK